MIRAGDVRADGELGGVLVMEDDVRIAIDALDVGDGARGKRHCLTHAEDFEVGLRDRDVEEGVLWWCGEGEGKC